MEGSLIFSVLNILLLLAPGVGLSTQTIKEGMEGRSLTLPCSCHPPCAVEWYKGMRIISKLRNGTIDYIHRVWRARIGIETGGADLTIYSLKASDEGEFFCTQSWRIDQCVFVRIVAPLTRVSIPEVSNGNLTLSSGDVKTLTCYVYGSPRPSPSYAWTIGDTPLESCLPGSRRCGFKADKSMDGRTLKCTATNIFNDGRVLSSADAEVMVTVHYLDAVTVEPPSVTVTEHATTSFRCIAMGNPSPFLQWRGSGFPPISGDQMFLRHIQRSAAGVYSCYANNSEGTNRGDVSLTVLFPPVIDMRYDPVNQTLTCTANGVPSVYNFSDWEQRFEGKLIRKLTGTSEMGTNQNILTLFPSSSADTGDYICSVTNGIGSPQSKQIFAWTHTRALFQYQQKNEFVISPDQTNTISVGFYANPTYSRVIWSRPNNSRGLLHEERAASVRIRSHGKLVAVTGTVTTLTLSQVSSTDGGEYTVVVLNWVNNVVDASAFQLNAIFSGRPPEPQSNDEVPVAIGTTTGALVLIILVTVGIICFWKRQKRKERGNEHSERVQRDVALVTTQHITTPAYEKVTIRENNREQNEAVPVHRPLSDVDEGKDSQEWDRDSHQYQPLPLRTCAEDGQKPKDDINPRFIIEEEQTTTTKISTTNPAYESVTLTARLPQTKDYDKIPDTPTNCELPNLQTNET